MATFNAFELLNGGPQVATSGKKKKNKKKSGAGAAEAAAEPAAPIPAASKKAQSNGHAANGHAANGASAPPSVVAVPEACAILERASREAKSLGDKARLWKDWIRQAGDKSGKGLKYKDTDGSLLEFKAVLLRSKAIETSVESCIASGLTQDKEDALAQLLLTFCSSSGDLDAPYVLASHLVRLSTLLADEAPDTVGAAQRAVRNVVCAMKAGESSGDAGDRTSYVARMVSLDKDIAKQEVMLQKLVSSGTGITKDHMATAKAVLKLKEEKMSLLGSDAASVLGSSAAASESTLSSLDELKNVINSHLKNAVASETKAGAAGDRKAQAVAGYQKEESILAQEASDVASQIRSLEAQLRTLRSKQSDIEEKRANLQQRQRVASGGAGGKGKAQGMSAAHYRDEISVVDGILALVDPRRAKTAPGEQVGGSQSLATLAYVEQGQQYLTLALAALREVPNKMAFSRQRLEKADKLIKLGGGSTQALQQKEEAEKHLAETNRSAAELMRGSLAVLSEVNAKYDTQVANAPDQAAAINERLAAMDSLGASIRQAYDSLQATATPAATPAVAAAPAAEARPVSAKPAAAPVTPAVQRPVSAAPAAKPAGGKANIPSAEEMAEMAAKAARLVSAPAASAVKGAPSAARSAAPRAAVPTSTRQWGKVDPVAAAPLNDAAGNFPSLS